MPIQQKQQQLAGASPAGTSSESPTPILPSLSVKQIEQILAENDAFLGAIQEFQSLGKVAEVSEYGFGSVWIELIMAI